MKTLTLVAILSAAIVCASAAHCAEYTFVPDPSNLGNLSHSYSYTWGFDLDIPDDEIVVGAQITFFQIYNWKALEQDRLYVHLLDDVDAGFTQIVEPDPAGDYFEGQGLLLGVFHDVDGPASRDDLTYDIPHAQLGWMMDGNSGFALDPDCHYYNRGVEVVVETEVAAIPEPASLVALLCGLGGVIWKRRKS